MKNINQIIHIEKISNELIFLNKNKIVKILKIEPINFSLKSDNDKEMIINEYNQFLKKNNMNFQIIIKSRKNDIEGYIKNLKLNSEDNLILENYLNFILSFLNRKNFEIKEFFLILSEQYNQDDLYFKVGYLKRETLNIIEQITKCGNSIVDITGLNEKDTIEIISYLLNERENLKYENIF